MKKLLAAVLFLSAVSLSAQVTLDTHNEQTVTGTTNNFNTTIGVNPNRIVIVCSTRASGTITALTFSGSSILANQIGTDTTSTNKGACYYQLAPSTGVQNMAITYSISQTSAFQTVTSFYNVNQASPLTTAVMGQATGTNPTVTANSSASGQAFSFLAHNGVGLPSVSGTGNVLLNVSNAGAIPYGVSRDADGNASEPMSWTAVSQNWGMITVGLKVAPASTRRRAHVSDLLLIGPGELLAEIIR